MNKFTSETENYMFSSFTKNDIKEYLEFLKNYYIDYREKLGLNSKETFGIEIEYEGPFRNNVDDFINNNYLGYGSIKERDFECGGEIITPKLIDESTHWIDIKNICDYLKKINVITDQKAGTHVHVGVHNLGKNIQFFKNFLYLYIVYEKELYRFANGERVNIRDNYVASAHPICLFLANNYIDIDKSSSFEELKNILRPIEREQGVNFENIRYDEIDKILYKNTIEFRMANGTKEEIIIQNLVNAYTKMIESSCSDKFDTELLEYKIDKLMNYRNYGFFNKINLKRALEFVDYIFDNNLDKTNFIRQYYKYGEEYLFGDTNFDLSKPIYTKRFIKK